MLGRKVAPMHREIQDSILNLDKHLRVMAARQCGKTTTLSDFVAWICWITDKDNPMVIKSPHNEVETSKLKIAYISHNLPQSTSVLSSIKETIMSTPLLQNSLFETEHLDRRWGSTQVKTKNGHEIYCLPFGSRIRGRALNFCILDDVLQDAETNVGKAKDAFWSAIYPAVGGEKGKILAFGTPMSYDDLLYDLADESKASEFACFDYPAVICDEQGEWLRPQFSELYTLDELKAKRDIMPPHVWSREYLLKPVSSGTAFFDYDWIQKACDLKIKTEPIAYYCGVDVAMSTAKDADYSVFTVIAEHPEKKYEVMEQVRKQGLRDEGIIDIILRLDKTYAFRRICIEQVGLSYGIVRELTESPHLTVKGENIPNPIKSRCYGYKTGGTSSNQSRDKLLSTIQLVLRDGNLAIPKMPKMVYELRGFSVRVDNGVEKVRSALKHDDTVFSLGFALNAAYANTSVVSAQIVTPEGIYGLEFEPSYNTGSEYNPFIV